MIDIEKIKQEKIKFYDQKRVEGSNSSEFYGNVPIKLSKNGKFYDVGATFFEDIYEKNLKIINVTNILGNAAMHYEGSSWHRTSGNKKYEIYGNLIYKRHYVNEIEKYREVNIEGRFI
jgi:hypothetical protein